MLNEESSERNGKLPPMAARLAARLRRYPGAAFTPAEIDSLHAAGWVNDWEEEFLRDTAHRTAGNYARRIAPSPKQLEVRLRINQRVLARLETEAERGGEG